MSKKNIIGLVMFCYVLFCFSQTIIWAQGAMHLNPEAITETVQGDVAVEKAIDASDAEKVVIDDEQKSIIFEAEHSDKPYVYLLYEVEVEVREDWTYKTMVHKRIRIQKPGHKSAGTIPIRYVKGQEEITSIEAYTIAANGEKYSHVKIQDRPVNRGHRSYSDHREKIITLPKISVGSVLDYVVVTESKGDTIDNTFCHAGYFDFGVPTVRDKYKVTLPKSLDIGYMEFNLDHKPVICDKGDTIEYVWDAKYLYSPRDDIKYEPFPTHENLTNIFEFSSIKDWSEISDWYYNLTSKNVVINEKMRKEAARIYEGEETLTQKVLALLAYFNDEFRYISMSFGENTFEPHRTDEVFRNKYGDCKDISLLFKTMLELGGIESSLALFAEEEASSDPQYDLPMPELFNHALLLVKDSEEGDFYLDPLLEGYFPGEYPLGFQGAYTFIINDQGGKFDRLPIFDEYRLYEALHSVYEIQNDGSAICEYSSLWDLDSSISIRKKLKSMSDEKIGKMFHDLDKGHSEVLEREWEGLWQKYGRIESYLKAREDNYFPVTGDMIILEMSSYDVPRNFDDIERETDFFYPYNALDQETLTFLIPDEFELMYMPEDVDLDIGFFHFIRKFKMINDKEIEVTQNEIFRRKTLSSDKLEDVKAFFEKLLKASDQRIMLRKQKPILEDIKAVIKRIIIRCKELYLEYFPDDASNGNEAS